MAKAGYVAMAGAAVALAAGTAKSVLSVISPAQFGLDLVSFEVSFDGITASAVPVLCELLQSTQATAGTSTAGTVTQTYGRTITPGFTTAYNFTVEPTALTSIGTFWLTPVGGTIIRDFPLGQTPDVGVSSALVLRLNAPAAVNCRPLMRFERA